MLLLSRLLHGDVLDAHGSSVGVITDVVARADPDRALPVVEYVELARRRRPSVLVPCTALDMAHPRHVRLKTAVAQDSPFAAGPPGDDEIRLARDVLDAQVVDITGRRVTRVADVVITRRAGGQLEVVGVEVGFDAVLRRLGATWLARRIGNDAIAWTDLHLLSERGHSIQLAAPSSAIHRLDARALATLVAQLGTGPAADILAAKAPALAADVIAASHPDDAERLLRALTRSKAADVVAAMPTTRAGHWAHRLSRTPGPRPRHFLRSGIWPRRRHGTRR